MRRTIAALAAVVTGLVTASPALAVPANDLFASAAELAPLPFHDDVDLAGAGTEPGEPQVCNFQSQSVWYRIAPTSAQALRIDLNGSDFGVVLNLYRAFGPGINNLSFAGCIGSGGSMNLTAEPGTTYYVQTGSVSVGTAHLRLNVESLPPPANDNLAAARDVGDLPYVDTVDTSLATVEPGEPLNPAGSFSTIQASVWYRFSPSEDGSYTFHANGSVTPILAAYTGALGDLTQVSGVSNFSRLTFKARAGTTYLFQLGRSSLFGSSGSFVLRVEKTPNPSVTFFSSPFDPSSFDTMQFVDSTFDPVLAGIESWHWSFGDGATADTSTPTHRYAADGDYTVKLTVTTRDGRIASTTRLITVKTHDIGIAKLEVPRSARAGQIRNVMIGVANRRYAESVQVVLYKSEPGQSERFLPVASATLQVPVRADKKTTNVELPCAFTAEDAAVGKVTLKVIVSIVGARDANPGDNTVIPVPVTVSP